MATNREPRSAEENQAGLSPALANNVADWAGKVGEVVRQMNALLKDYKKCSIAGTATDVFVLKAWLQKNAEAFRNTRELESTFERLSTALKEASGEALLTLEANLKEALENKGWKVDGQWPEFYIERVVRLNIDEVKCMAHVGLSAVQTLHVPTLISCVSEQLKKLLPPKFNAKKFLESMVQCYDRQVTEREPAISIWALYKELLLSTQTEGFWRSGNPALFRTITEQAFRACLTELLNQGELTTRDGRILKLSPPIRAEEGMYLFLPSEKRFAFIGRVQFMAPLK